MIFRWDVILFGVIDFFWKYLVFDSGLMLKILVVENSVIKFFLVILDVVVGFVNLYCWGNISNLVGFLGVWLLVEEKE